MVKKGFFFSLMSVFFLLIFFVVANTFLIQTQDSDLDTQRTYSVVLNTFFQNVEQQHLPAITQIAFSQAISKSIEKIYQNEFAFEEETLTQSLFSLMKNGTYAQHEFDILHLDSLLTNFSNLVQQELGITITTTVNESYFTVQHTDSAWRVSIQIVYFVSVQSAGFPTQNRSFLIRTTHPITGFLDPLRAYYNATPLYITRTTIQPGQWNVEALQSHAELSQFSFRQNQAPSFLQRLVNDSSASFFGIESFVNDTTGFSQIQNRSSIDHAFFQIHDCQENPLYTHPDLDPSIQLSQESFVAYVTPTEFLQRQIACP